MAAISMFYSDFRYYTWSLNSSNTELEFVPMLWGQDQVAEFSTMINQTIASRHVTTVLGMNELVPFYAVV
jgi:hypothetical protein